MNAAINTDDFPPGWGFLPGVPRRRRVNFGRPVMSRDTFDEWARERTRAPSIDEIRERFGLSRAGAYRWRERARNLFTYQET